MVLRREQRGSGPNAISTLMLKRGKETLQRSSQNKPTPFANSKKHIQTLIWEKDA